MFVRRVGRVLVCVGVLVVLLGGPTSGPSVTIADGALTPPVMVVPAGGSVLWTNRGTRQHAIVAVGGAFPPFSLAPDGARSVPFLKPGKYPYLLDGAVKGTVFVVGSGGGGGEGTGGGGQSSASGTDCVTIYRYDVRVAVHREVMPADNVVGTVSGWKASWVAPLYLDRCAGMKLLITARPAAMSGNRGWPIVLHGGQFDRTFDWNDTTKLYAMGEVRPCHFTYTSNVPAEMSVTAKFGSTTASPGGSSFDFSAGQDFSDEAASKADFERAADARHAACDPKRPGITYRYTTIPINGIPGMIGDNGIIGDNSLHLYFAMPPNSAVEASILDSLVAGKGFNYDTGTQLFQDKAGNSSRVRATVSFSPSRE
jgi:hypothetical protein